MKLANKLLLLVLALIMCMSCFVACGDGDTTTVDPGNLNLNNNVPGLQNKDYAGKICNIWHRKNDAWGCSPSMYTTEQSANAVSKAATARLNAFQSATGITLKFTESTIAGSSAPVNSDDIKELRSLLGSNNAANAYDIVIPGGSTATTLSSEGFFTNLAGLSSIDLSDEAWHQNINDNLAVAGGYYTVSGMFSVSNVSFTTCIFFDKTALEDLREPSYLENTDASDFVDVNSLYEWAAEGTWTFDKLLALSAAFATPNGSVAVPGTESEGDYYGYEFQGTGSGTLITATGKMLVSGDPANQNIPTLKVAEPETVKVLNWLIDNIIDKPYVHVFGGSDGATGTRYFGLGHQALFTSSTVGQMSVYAQLGAEDGASDFSFGVLPMPKMDYSNDVFGGEAKLQDRYYGSHIAWCSSLAAIPNIAQDKEFAGFVLQTFTEMGLRKWTDDPNLSTIWDAYVEDGLEGRYAPDPQDEDMLDLVLASATSDFGGFQTWSNAAAGALGNTIRDKMLRKEKNWEVYASTIKKFIDDEVIVILQKQGRI